MAASIWSRFAAALLGVVLLAAAAWSVLHVGMRVYTADDGGDSDWNDVCPAPQATTGCKRVPFGTPAVVTAIALPHIRLRAADGSWSGWATPDWLQPDVPAGTIATIEKRSNTTLTLAAEAAADSVAGVDVGARVTVKVLRYDHRAYGIRALYVQVLDGRYAGRRGYMYATDAVTKDGGHLDGVEWNR